MEFERRLRQLSRRLSLRRRGRGELDERLDQSVAALQAQLERIALVEAGSVLGPLAGMARELAREQGGELVIRLRGMDLLAERQVLQGLRDPAIQLLRNAVSHGLRPGRAVPLQVELSLALRVGRLELRVEDDGPGPDLGRIERVARERGLLPAERPMPGRTRPPCWRSCSSRASPPRPGSTACPAAAWGCRSWPRRRAGCTAPRRCGAGPPAAASCWCRCRWRRGGRRCCWWRPATRCSGCRAMRWSGCCWWTPRRSCGRMAGRCCVSARRGPGRAASRRWPGWRRCWAGRATGQGAADGRLSGALLAVRGRRCLVVVERLRDVRTLLVRAPDLVGIDRRLVAGLATDGEGRTVLVLEPQALLAALLDAPPPTVAAAIPPEAAARRAAPATVLVVDDSITTRTLEKTILQAQGYRVMVAVDGLAALDVLRTAQWEIDVVVADVEMPRLDGFGLLAAMRDDPRLAGVPTILMTSRNQQADIRRGLELGARAYIAKQDFDQGTLLSTIAQLLP